MSLAWPKFIKLAGIALGLWFFFAILTPWLVERVPAWKKYGEVQEEQGLDSGALYYSNVPQTQEAEAAMREAVRRGMAERRANRVAERQ